MDNAVIIALVSVALIVIATISYLIIGSPEERMMRQRIAKFVDPSAVARFEAESEYKLRAQQAKTMAPTLDVKLKKLLPSADNLRLRVERAGYNASLSTIFLVLVACVSLATFLVGRYMGQEGYMALLVGTAIGLTVPTFYISMKGASRIKEFTKSLPDAIDLIVRNVRSGLPVAEGVHAVGSDLSGPVGEEFKRISDQIKIGVPLEEAMEMSVKRVAVTDFAFLTIALSIQKETGGNLSEALGNLSRLLRARNQMILKVRALTSEARSSAMIIGALPFVVIGALVLINPGYVSVLFNDPTGQTVSMVALLSMLVGYAVMAKMVRFQV